MVIYVIDDEPLQLRLLNSAVLGAEPEAEVHNFLRAKQVIDAVAAGDAPPDVVFLDVELPAMGGLKLAEWLKERDPTVNIVFVAGYGQYMADALAMHVSGYIRRPVTPELVRRELADLRHPKARTPSRRARANTFGNFEFFIDGEPVKFRYAKTKEFLAYLVDRQGASSNTAELCAALWEDAPNTVSIRNQFRNLVSDLTRVLRDAGLEPLFIKNRNSFAVDTKMLDCDMYRFQQRDMTAVNAYFGEYMAQYAWAEARIGYLESKT